jgi:hypothetical protein
VTSHYAPSGEEEGGIVQRVIYTTTIATDEADISFTRHYCLHIPLMSGLPVGIVKWGHMATVPLRISVKSQHDL